MKGVRLLCVLRTARSHRGRFPGFPARSGDHERSKDAAVALGKQFLFPGVSCPRTSAKLLKLGRKYPFRKGPGSFSVRRRNSAGFLRDRFSGRVALESHPGGREKRVQIRIPVRSWAGRACSAARNSSQARALEPVVALALEVADLRAACASNPYFGCAFLERPSPAAAERLEVTRAQLAGAMAEPSTRRAESATCD